MRCLPLVFLLAAAPALACPADCDGDRTVAVDELVTAVQVALDAGGAERCAAADVNGDQRVTIEELIAAVGAALSGCPSRCGDGAAPNVEDCDDGNRRDGDGCSGLCALEAGGDPCAGVAAFPGAAARAVLVAEGLEKPVHVAAPPLDPHRVFIVEQPGRIRVVADGALLAAPFLAIETRASCCGERGLLSVAFHPDYERNGRFFVNYTDNAGATVVARYEVSADANRADADSERILLTIAQPFDNHNGGQLAFGPDGYLYVGMGDGGSGGDPREAGQDDDTLLAKLLRLDVDVDESPYVAVPPDNPHLGRGLPLDLIWAKGLRNPWRFSFDRGSGALFIGDVGQNDFEEISVQPAGSRGGENYGWDVFEGFACFEAPPPAPFCPDQIAPFTPPVLAYGRDDGCSVTGGFVYRGCALPGLHGQYFFSDYCSGFVRTFALVDGVVTGLQERTAALAPGNGREIGAISSFGEDARGELYIVDYDGEVYRLERVASE